MLFPISLAFLGEFQYYNYIFDGIVILATLIYLMLGLKRGFLRTIWFVVFDVISITAAYCIYKFACPLFVPTIPVVLVGLIPATGIAFMLTALYELILSLLISVIAFLIIRFGIFKRVLTAMDDHDYNIKRRKKTFARICSALLTAGLAFMLSSGAIVATNRLTTYTFIRNYETEMSETYVAKYGEKAVVSLLHRMINTNSVPNPHDLVVGAATNDKYSYSDVDYYRESVYRTLIAHDVDYYLAIIEIDSEIGYVRFSRDLVIWAAMAEKEGATEMLDTLVKPIVEAMHEKGYHYEGDLANLAPVTNHIGTFASDTYSYISSILY